VSNSRAVDTVIPGLNRLLRDLNKLPKEYKDELRDASQDIATRLMVPAWQAAAMTVGGAWGKLLSDSIRAKRDRIPAVTIGYTGQVWRLSGGRDEKWGSRTGANPTMLRWPTHSGDRGASFAPFVRTGWMNLARPAYIGPAMGEWADAVSRVCRDFNNGPDY
jgi:hypothetical protein